jgi:gamma-glutamyltranspeptidase / glutathione hydrolase
VLAAGVAAGHPATCEAGLEILAAGGTAADAAVAASLVSCVAETVMTGLLGGGHAVYHRAGDDPGSIRTLDFFCAVPGLGAPPRKPELLRLEVPFGAELVHYAVGIASCAVPGVPAGLQALWEEHGRLEWRSLVEPALRLARIGVPMTPAHASCLRMLAPVMTMREGARIYAPAGRLLEPWEPLQQPGLVRALELIAEEGARGVYEGTLAAALLELMEERGGLVSRRDLEAYEVRRHESAQGEFQGVMLHTRAGPYAPLSPLASLPPLADLSAAERALALAAALDAPALDGHTTNLCVVDDDGSVCVLTTSLGLGSGDWLPGYDAHLNSMLGEADLLVGPLVPGERMLSMMSPTLGFMDEGLELAIGSAGGTRLRSALVQVIAGILDEGLDTRTAIERPRLHRIGEVVHLEPGFPDDVVPALAASGYEARTWEAQHHYFGGVSAIARSGPAADPRRSGAAAPLRPAH